MISALVGLIVLIVIVGIVYYVVSLLIDLLPMDGNFKQIAKILILLVAVLIILMKALPMLGVAIP